MGPNRIEDESPSLLDVVALLTDVPAHRLARGQVGTVVERLGDETLLVEFSDDQGRAYALAPSSDRTPHSALCAGAGLTRIRITLRGKRVCRLRDSDGTLCAALAISAPAARLSIGKALQQLPFMMQTADKLGEQFSRKHSVEQAEE